MRLEVEPLMDSAMLPNQKTVSEEEDYVRLITSNAALKSSNTSKEKFPEFTFRRMSLTTRRSAVSVLNPNL